ncbi:hypothetical protein C0R09_01335 [Brevibacillus laterosporus]|uniref:Wadjet anti-phage system protein JetD domain-containing protein n=1 Tax=Brevibacillus laterosporus TaxID=1465 RepID=UPI000C77FCD6|nr:Wadjet anti-phage system protein JetD domain-containing protein [Brevibacillus laterosporus]AUM63301.1 hypothetical protein C0R09_01335 [Brevibacillus laterosporus]
MVQCKQKLIQKLVERQKKSRTKIDIDELEQLFIKQFSSIADYQEAGGYKQLFYPVISEVEQEQYITPMKNNVLNNRFPPLPKTWWLQSKEHRGSWSEIDMLQVSDLLSLQYYRQHPNSQTQIEWEHIKCVHAFLKNMDMSGEITKEERSYQLFGDEKFLGSVEGKAFLSRIKLSLDDLQARNLGEPFTYFVLPHVTTQTANNLLILENRSTFHTCNRYFSEYTSFVGFCPDVVIFGEGDHIVSSLSFLYDIFPRKKYRIWYAGDIDAAGIGIYCRLRDKYPDESIRLALPLYKAMVDLSWNWVPSERQIKQKEHLQRVIMEFEEEGMVTLVDVVKTCWQEEKRVPQEALNFYTMKAYQHERGE